MDRERYQRLKSVLAMALELPAAERETLIRRECADDLELQEAVRDLLDDTGRETEALSPVAALDSQPPVVEVEPGARIGRYELIDRIGEGGMGAVWRARQDEPVRREVAVKILRGGCSNRDLLRRFEDERQLLARLDHPGLAKVFDGGVSDGRPYFVMELVRGTTIDRFCRESSLDLRARLELFLQACRAVQHAHTKGIIHRDLKPSNVLVSELEGQAIVKVIDFGIAKVIQSEDETATRVSGGSTIVGTPDYMSPEQARGASDIDTRTDVYSLGVLLYALLTDQLPFDRASDGLNGVLKRIQEAEPTRPSARIRRTSDKAGSLTIPNDLDWIVLRCLEKEPSRRYGTAEALARDIGRFLANRPVEAAPPSNWYRARKLYRRHRAAVVASCLGFVILILGAIGTSTGLLEATRMNRLLQRAIGRAKAEATRASLAEEKAKQRAEDAVREARIAAAVNEFLNEDLLGAVSPSEVAGQGRDVSMREVLDAAGAKIERAGQPGGRFAAMPLVEAAIRETLGRTYRKLGFYEPARVHIQRAVDIYDREEGASPARRLLAKSDLALSLADLGMAPEAESLLTEILETYGGQVGFEHRVHLAALLRLGNLYGQRGDYDASKKLLEDLLVQCELHLGEADVVTADTMGALARVLVGMGEVDRAGELFERNLEMSRRLYGERNPTTLDSLTNYAAFLTQKRHTDEARPLLLEALSLNQEINGPEHPKTLATLQNLGFLAQLEGDYALAKQYFEDRCSILRRVLGREHPDTLRCQVSLGDTLDHLGETEAAGKMLRETFETLRRVRGADHPDWIAAAKALLRYLYHHEQLEEAGPLFREVLEREERILGVSNPETLKSLSNLAMYHRRLGQHDEAIRLIHEAVRRASEARGAAELLTLTYRLSVAKFLEFAGRFEDAAQECRLLSETTRTQLPKTADLHVETLQHLGANLLELGDKAAAKAAIEEALAVARADSQSPFLGELEELLATIER